ncbi:hypothetical protein ACOSP7_019175 [Xanthoceras sorbifolium]
MRVHITSVSGPSRMHSASLDPSFNARDPRAIIWFLLRSSRVCSSRAAPHRLGLHFMSHHHHRSLRRCLLLPDLLSPAHSHLRSRVVVRGVCFITDPISPHCFGLVGYTCFHWLIVLACF